MESPTASVSASASLSSFKILSFFLKTFRKRFDYYCNEDNEDSSEIERKKWLIEATSMLYKFFGGGKFSACYRIGSKIEEDDSSSESDDDEEQQFYRDGWERILETESIDGSETVKKFPGDEKISRHSKLSVSILDVFSNFHFNFMKSRICKGRSGSRENLKRLVQIPSRERKEMKENSRVIPDDDDDDDANGEEELWQKRILMGGKCKPLI